MNSENIKNNDPIQLKQMIIFLKAELTKYEHKVKEYKDSYHYSVIENLEQENAQLTKENNDLRKQLHEMQRERYSPSVDAIWKTKTEWLPVNKQLNGVMKKLKDATDTNQTSHRKQERQITSLHKKVAAQKSSLEQFESRLVIFIQKATNQLHNQIENVSITHEERLRFEELRRRLLKKIEEKNIIIEKLQQEIVDMQEQNKISEDSIVMAVFKSESARTSKMLLHLEHQMKKVLAKSLDSEEKWEAKLNALEDVNQRFLRKIEEKDKIIEKLQHEITKAKEQKNMPEDNEIAAVLKSEFASTSKTLSQLEQQLKRMSSEYSDPEGKWEAKLNVIGDLNQRYLTEIEEKNNVIKKLQHEAKTSETLLQLECQLKDVLAKSSDFEEKWEAKSTVFEDVNQRYLKEIEEKNNKIEELQLEIKDLKKQKKIAKDNLSQVVSESVPSTSETLLLLERQMKEVLAKSLDYEVKLDAKLDIINDLELKLEQLSEEIDNIQDFDAMDENLN